MRKNSSRCAFSLVEVVLALAIVSFCMMTLLALIPVGLGNTKESLQTTEAASITTQIAADLNATPATSSTSTRFQINLNNAGPNTLFFADDGSYSANVPAPYQATVVVTPQNGTTTTTTTARIIITWPGLAGTPGALPTSYQGSYETVTALDRSSL